MTNEGKKGVYCNGDLLPVAVRRTFPAFKVTSFPDPVLTMREPASSNPEAIPGDDLPSRLCRDELALQHIQVGPKVFKRAVNGPG